MKKKYLGLFAALLGTAAVAGGKPEPGMPPNLAVDINGPGAARAEIVIASTALKEERRYSLTVSDGGLVGGIYVPPGKENRISITVLDARGEKLYTGSGYANVDEKFTPQVDIALNGKETKDPISAKFGSYRFALDLAANAGDGLLVQTTLIDAAGKHFEIKPDDIKWGGLPEKFEVLPYSCFNGSLCFELPDITKYADMIACFRDVVCSHKKPRDTRGPYRFVAVGRTHTCALTVANDLLCWGDNHAGQLRSTAPNCTTGTFATDCSPFPTPVECGPGEVCKFQSVSAGAERTCAVDTAGRAWCWGTHGDVYTGEADLPGSSQYRINAEVEAEDSKGNKVLFTSIDTDLTESCAISTARELYCWRFNPQVLGDGAIHNKGTQYKSVSVGKRHICAQTMAGKIDCWGDNYDGQITGTFPVPGPVNSVLNEILTRGGHVPAAGATSTCAQDPDDNTICWGSPDHNVPLSPQTGGWIALWRSYATSTASNTHTCQVGGGSFPCTRTCVTGLGGDLFCGNWMSGAKPSQLTMVPDPASDHFIVWNQSDVGPNHVCAVSTQQDVWCFGKNGFGQFGTGTVSSSTAVTDVPTQPASRFPNGIATLAFP